MSKSKNKLFLPCVSAVFCAMICIFILLLHIPTGTGYVHMGDSLIYLVSCILPAPYAIFAASVGAGLADFFSGYSIYIIPSMIIKALLVLQFTSKIKSQILTKRNIIASITSVAVTVLGYAIAETLIYAVVMNQAQVAVSKALTTIPGNLIQAIVSAIIFVCIGKVLDKMKLKSKIKF